VPSTRGKRWLSTILFRKQLKLLVPHGGDPAANEITVLRLTSNDAAWSTAPAWGVVVVIGTVGRRTTHSSGTSPNGLPRAVVLLPLITTSVNTVVRISSGGSRKRPKASGHRVSMAALGSTAVAPRLCCAVAPGCCGSAHLGAARRVSVRSPNLGTVAVMDASSRSWQGSRAGKTRLRQQPARPAHYRRARTSCSPRTRRAALTSWNSRRHLDAGLNSSGSASTPITPE
jgi:hypothetical protein